MKYIVTSLLLVASLYVGAQTPIDLLDTKGVVIMKMKSGGDIVEPGSDHVKIQFKSATEVRTVPGDENSCTTFSNDSIFDLKGDYMGRLESGTTIRDMNNNVLGHILITDHGRVIKDMNGDVLGSVVSTEVPHIFLAYYYCFFLPEYRGL